MQKDEKGWFYTRGRESSGGTNCLKTYICTDANLTKDEAIKWAEKNRPQPCWDTWIGKPEIAKAYGDYGTGTYAYTPNENVNYDSVRVNLLKTSLSRLSKQSLVLSINNLFKSSPPRGFSTNNFLRIVSTSFSQERKDDSIFFTKSFLMYNNSFYLYKDSIVISNTTSSSSFLLYNKLTAPLRPEVISIVTFPSF